MIEIVSKIFEVLQSGNFLWLIVFIIVALFMKVQKILEFIEVRKKKQINRLLEASSCNFLDEKFNEFLSFEIQSEYFQYISNISADKKDRDRIFEIHKKSDGRLPFFHIRRASSFFNFEDGVRVELSFFDKLHHVYNYFGMILFLFLGLLLFIRPALENPVTISQALIYVGSGLFSLLFAFLFLSQTFPYYSAKKVRDEIRRQEEEKQKNDDTTG